MNCTCQNNKNQGGYVALLSAILITFLLAATAVHAGLYNISLRFNALDSEAKTKSVSLAKACLEYARLSITQGTYLNREIIYLGSSSEDSCTIMQSQKDFPSIGQSSIITRAIIRRSYTTLQMIIDANNTILSLKECPKESIC